MYAHYRVRRISHKAARIVTELFQAFMDDVRLLPPHYQDKLGAGEPAAQARALAAYIPAITDRYAIRDHKRLFDPAELT